MLLQPSPTLSLSNYTTNNQSKSWMNNYKDNDYTMMPVFHWLTESRAPNHTGKLCTCRNRIGSPQNGPSPFSSFDGHTACMTVPDPGNEPRGVLAR